MILKHVFENGSEITLEQILANKEWRANKQNDLMNRFPEASLISIKMNIPGAMKQSPAILAMFQRGLKTLESMYAQNKVEEVVYFDRVTGPEAFIVVNQSLHDAKINGIRFEQTDSLGRIFDVDVMSAVDDGQQLSRTELGFDVRKCFVCGEDAKVCARTQQHSKTEMTAALDNIYQTFLVNQGAVIDDNADD
ncbi:citrate lyase holo-[acyl-carrier protein] synthase [Weissella viridescens]|uniref:citrate lyase holo-[acyl-carrier protein] synthase n=1 Tax=Weissella viridescens TaxID=1629 RepID=UPI001D06906D|nr:citrate lyase holo-[acyl-carrier protein] synthase [Weissella viridescens]MCB6839891.1 citrate lyase holo-[acyl-carrier protein] synthase [Weissella viridescens]MCB6846623.1 citrate lyase holo-[acyl-carrier protein] synthase [Weissella viridescens]WJI90662.1 citrate lyase holo-[acyl-carrier protein] synthase [Weissella viridescens]